MMRVKKFYHRKFDGFQFEEYLLIFTATTIFLPFFFSLGAIVVVLLYLLYKGRLLPIVKQYPKAKYPLIFCVLTFCVSLYYGNNLGAICSVGILVVFLFLLFYRSIVTKRLFELIVDASCIASLFCFAYALLEYGSIIESLNYPGFTIEDDPLYRVNSTFFNANYYAMMIEFLILMCIYKMMNARTKRRVIFYILTIACNLMGLYLSGCRTAWIPFVITVPLMFLLNNHKRFFAATVAIMFIAVIALVIDPNLFPRADSFGIYLDTRIEIWQVAIQGIKDYPLFGQGPLTYMLTCETYQGPLTQHAHSVYLDPFLSFGISGVLLLGIYFYQQGKEIWHLYSQKIDVRLFSLILAFIVTVFVHGILDYTIFWVQTAQIFLLVLTAASIYTNGRHTG